MYYVYVLECSNGSLYTGLTNDLPHRMMLHASGKGAKYTRSFPPRRLAMLWQCADKTAAARLEYAFKTLPRAQKCALMTAPCHLNDLFPDIAESDYLPLPHVTLATLPKAERTEEEGASSLEKTAP